MPLVLVGFTITLKGINTFRGKKGKNQHTTLRVRREKSYPDITLIHTMLTNSLRSIIGVKHLKDVILLSKTFPDG